MKAKYFDLGNIGEFTNYDFIKYYRTLDRNVKQ